MMLGTTNIKKLHHVGYILEHKSMFLITSLFSKFAII